MRALFPVVAAAVLLSAPAMAAPSWRDFSAVSNTSTVEPNGERFQQLSIEVPAPPAQVWAALTTAEGWKSWATPYARVDFRVGGLIETSYDAAAKAPDIANQIIAYAPGRVLVIRNVKAPRDFAEAEAFSTIATIVELEPVGANATRVRITGAGYRPGKAYDTLYERFEWGNAYSLDQLRLRFVRGPKDWTRPAEAQGAASATKTVTGANGG